jgi:hypothetical protein
MERLRSFLDYARFRASLRARVALDIAMALAGLALIGFGGHSTVDILGAAITLIGTALLFRDIRQRSRRRLNVRLSDNGNFLQLAKKALPPEGFQKAALGKNWYVTSEEINLTLDRAANPIILLPNKFEAPAEILDYLEQSIVRHAPDYNEDKVGLRTDITLVLLNKNNLVQVQHSDYFRGLATNEMADKKIERCDDNKRRRQEWTTGFTMSNLVFDERELRSLNGSRLANNIGVTSLLITTDHHVVLQDQGSQSVVDPGRTNLGSSGSLDLEDIYDKAQSRSSGLRTLQGALRHGMEREAEEETSAAVGPGKSSTVLTGYARYLHRGGKPEFFGITRTASHFDALEPQPSELKFVHRIDELAFEPTPAGLIEVIEKLIGRCEAKPDQFSPSMTVGLRLARSYVQRFGLDLSPLPGS